jgi:glutaredoxin 2
VYQLTQQELNQFNIEHYGAVFNIDYKKENVIMITKLQTYRAELENLKAQELNKDYTAEIEQKVSEYRTKLQTEYAAQTDAYVSQIDNDLNCIDWLIKREMETAQVVEESLSAVNPAVTILRG